jgi:hypothetical protein
MVRQGTSRFRDAHDRALNQARNGPDITETEPPRNEIKSQLQVDVLTTIFQDLNLAIQALATIWLSGGDSALDGGDGTTSSPADGATDVSGIIGTIGGP